MRALYTAATGMSAQQLKIDNIANNLANVSTHGFKKSRADFEDLYYQKVRTGGGQTAGGTRRSDVVEIGHGTRAASLRRDFGQGTIESTSRDTDVAILGQGMFVLNTAEGEEVYTRSGSFAMDDQGNLITDQGLKLADDIVVPEGATGISVSGDGVVLASLSGQEDQEIGTIQLARFTNPAGLEGLGGGLFRATGLSGEAQLGQAGLDGFGELRNQALETSNVDVAEELIAMIMAQRAYELTGKAITAADEMLQTTNQIA